MPPIQWEKERHMSMDLGSASISVKIVAPVVENPEHISKKASINLGIVPEITKGMAEMADIKSHVTAAMRNPLRRFKSVSLRFIPWEKNSPKIKRGIRTLPKAFKQDFSS